MKFIEKKIGTINVEDVKNLDVNAFYDGIKILENYLSQITFWETYEYAKKKTAISEINLEIKPIPSYLNNITPEKIRQNVQATASSISFSGNPSHTICKKISLEVMNFADIWNKRIRLDADNNPVDLFINKDMSDSENYQYNRENLQWDIPGNTILRNIQIQNILSLKEYRKLKKNPAFNQELSKIEKNYFSATVHMLYKMTGEIIVDMFRNNKEITVNVNNNVLSERFISTNNDEINDIYSEHIKKLESPLLRNYIYNALKGSSCNYINSHNFGETIPASMKLMRDYWLDCKNEFNIVQEKKHISEMISSLNIDAKKNNRI